MDNQHKHIIGIGIGPANLALATALEEYSLHKNLMPSCIFLDKHPLFTWHTGMLLPGALLQVPFVRDLATLRNPQSPFTFLNYLKTIGRLDKFINLRTFFPSRLEFHQYLSWVCDKLSHLMQFNCEVIGIKTINNMGKTANNKHLVITYNHLQKQEAINIRADNIVIGAGKQPNIPKIAQLNDKRIIHTANLLHQVPIQFESTHKPYHFTVIGSGQSAGEVVLYLLQNYPNAQVHWCFRNYVLHSIDNSPYINRAYHADVIEKFFNLPQSSKQRALQDMQSSNYAVVDNDILIDLFELQYSESLQGKNRLHIYNGSGFKSVSNATDNLTITLENLFENTVVNLSTDALILATGYQDTPLNILLSELEEYILKNPDGTYQVNRDYSLKTHPILDAKIYLQGYCEQSHGPSEPTLATLATRAETILSSIIHPISINSYA